MRSLLLRKHVLLLSACVAANVAYAGQDNNETLTEKLTTNKLVFVQNKGQVTDQYGHKRTDIDFQVKGKGLNLFIGDGQMHYQWTTVVPVAQPVTIGLPKWDAKTEVVNAYRMDVVLLGANINAVAIATDKQAYYERHYRTQTPNGVIANTYRKITYKEIYPKIDWVIYVNDNDQDGIKYDFIVHEGGDASKIKLKYNGAATAMNEAGEMTATTPMGSVIERAPYSYIAASKEEIPSSFTYNDNTLGFNITQQKGDVVIDPTLDWSTYFGGSLTEFGYAVATDTGGNAYLVGHTNSVGSIATTGAYQTSFNADKDAYMAKFSKAGVLQWGTYYGNAGSDNFFYATVDDLGNVYAAGITSSNAGITTSGSQQSGYGGGASDAYMVKFNSSGSRQWATYFGGGSDEAPTALFDYYMVSIAFSATNNRIYLCGATSSGSGIATSGSQQSAIGGLEDGYLASFNTSGVLQWATYMGGTGNDKTIKIATQRGGSAIYVTGETASSGMATASAHQSLIGGGKDAFVAAYNSSGVLQWRTYYGGTNDDASAGIATDGFGDVYIAGSTTSLGGIATTGSFQPGLAVVGPSGASDAFLVKFNSSGTRQWGTYFGGVLADHTADIAIDGTGNICFSGTAGSSGLATAGQTTFGGNSDAYIAIFTPNGDRNWVSYLGGSNADNAYGISYSRSGDLYIAGSSSSSGIATTGAHQFSLSGTQDAILAKYKADTTAYILGPITPSTYCAGDSIHVNFGITNPFKSGNVFTLELSSATGNFNAAKEIGTLTSTNPGTIHGKIPDSVIGGLGFRVRIKGSSPGTRGFDNGVNLVIKTLPDTPIVSSNAPICSDKDLELTTESSTSGVSYSWKGPGSYTSTTQNPTITKPPVSASGYYISYASLNGCTSKDSVQVTISQAPAKPTVGSNTPVCAGNTINLTSSSSTAGVGYGWTGPSSFASTTQNPTRTGAVVADSGWYVVTATLGTCVSKDSVLVDVEPSGLPVITAAVIPGVNICIGDSVVFSATATDAGSSPVFQWYLNGAAVGNAGPLYGSKTIVTGDKLHCVLIASGACLIRTTDTSAKFTMNSSGNIVPTVKLVAMPGTNVPTGTAISFRAVHTAGGNNPVFKWFVNDIEQVGETGVVFTATVDLDIKSGDKVHAIMRSDLTCAEPDTAISPKLQVGTNINVGIGTLGNTADWQIYPNPNNGKFTLKGNVNAGSALNMEIINALGQVVYSKSITPAKNEINETIDAKGLAAGVYLLRLKAGDDIHTIRLTVGQ